jgi:hypothetical protein
MDRRPPANASTDQTRVDSPSFTNQEYNVRRERDDYVRNGVTCEGQSAERFVRFQHALNSSSGVTAIDEDGMSSYPIARHVSRLLLDAARDYRSNRTTSSPQFVWGNRSSPRACFGLNGEPPYVFEDGRHNAVAFFQTFFGSQAT